MGPHWGKAGGEAAQGLLSSRDALLMSWCHQTCYSNHYLYLLSEFCSGQALCWAVLGSEVT